MTNSRREQIIWNIVNHSFLTVEKIREVFNHFLEIGFDDNGPIDYEELARNVEQYAHPELFSE